MPSLKEVHRATFQDLDEAKEADIFAVFAGARCVVTISEDGTGKVVYERQIASDLPRDLG